MNLSFRQGPYTLVKLLLLVLLSLGLLVADHRFRAMEPVRAALGTIVAPIQYVVTLPGQLFGLTSETFKSHTTLLEENQALREKQLRQEARLQRLWTLEQENARLRSLLDASRQVEEHVQVAEIVGVDLDPFRQKVVINRGEPDATFVGQPVIDARGVIGQVVHVGPFASEVMLISDPSHSVPVRVARNGLRSVAFGNGKTDQLDLRFIPNSADIRAGDIIVTSGLGGRFPPDYPVAVVTRFEPQPGRPFAAVSASPMAELNHVQEVLLVWRDRESPAAPETAAPAEPPG